MRRVICHPASNFETTHSLGYYFSPMLSSCQRQQTHRFIWISSCSLLSGISCRDHLQKAITILMPLFPSKIFENVFLTHAHTHHEIQFISCLGFCHMKGIVICEKLLAQTGFVHIFKVKFKYFTSTFKGSFQKYPSPYCWHKMHIC